MKKYVLISLAGVVLLGTGALAAPDKTKGFLYNAKEYFVVTSKDTALDTGKEVCAKYGKTCIGYTAFNNEVCKFYNPGASSTKSVNGSKAGFYCDGPPQKGLACEGNQNNCQNCPNCNVNADCNTVISQQFREMYVECTGGEPLVAEPSRWGRFRSALAHRWNAIRQGTRSVFTRFFVKKVTVQVTGPKGEVTSVDLPTDVVACEFFQVNKKLVTCGAIKAADTFCTQAMQSRHARSVLCQENGVIVCVNPCNPPEKQVPLKQCAFDNDRTRGKQAPPLDFCIKAISTTGPQTGTKKAGEVCVHGGECTTGNCLGQPSDQGIKYFCSCDPFKLDFTCNK